MKMYAIAAAVVCLAGTLWGQRAPQPSKVSEVKFADAIAGKSVQIVLVKDWIKIENRGGLAKSVEFERYCPIADDEQIVLGRWVSARTEGGTELPADLSAAREYGADSIVQTVRVRPMPPGQRATVTLTTLVARRERPAPSGKFPIPSLYPKGLREFLDASEMVAVKDPYVQQVAKDLLAKTTDAYEIAGKVAEMAKERTYLPSGPETDAKSLAASVLKSGGSCCASAVAAAAVLRACGIPAQVTYCPAGYVHGIVRFWLKDYGWVRMDATSGTGVLPLAQDEHALGLVRLFDMPTGMEKLEFAYAWPFQHNDENGPLPFKVDGAAGAQVGMAQDPGNALPWEQEPFPHLEPGSWNAVLGSEKTEQFPEWGVLVQESRRAVKGGATGAYKELVEKLGLGRYVEVAETWGVMK